MSGSSRRQLREPMQWLMQLQGRGWGTSLAPMRRAMKLIGNPQNELTAIHVAGTNGKGSVCAMVASMLQASGLRVGRYISPHLLDVRERITVNGRAISEGDLVDLIERTKDALEGAGMGSGTRLTFFEFITAIGMRHFVENEVDVAVLETGFGGRLDATNILPRSIAVITQVGRDHTEYLGRTIREIAGEKAGIIKKRCRVVSSAIDPMAMSVVRAKAREKNCRIIENGRDFAAEIVRVDLSRTSFDYRGTRELTGVSTNLLGSHQAENAATSIASCDELASQQGFGLTDAEISAGLRKVVWPGRLDVVSKKPLTILDCGHNPPAIRRLITSLDELEVRPDTIIYASSKDKDFRTSTRMLFPRAKRLILTRYGAPRSEDPEALSRLPSARGKPVFIARDISEAFDIAKDITPKRETVLVVGSVFLVGDALSWLRHGKGADFSLAGF